MQSLFVVDWSFIFVVCMLALLVVMLTLRAKKRRRAEQREQKRRAKRAYNTWLSDSNMLPLDDADPGEHQR